MMRCAIISTEQEFNDAVEKHEKEGLRLAAVSNAGLQHPKRRLTFLPKSAFRDEPQR